MKQITKQDLVDHLRTGCKPESQWRCVTPKALRAFNPTSTFCVFSMMPVGMRWIYAGL